MYERTESTRVSCPKFQKMKRSRSLVCLFLSSSRGPSHRHAFLHRVHRVIMCIYTRRLPVWLRDGCCRWWWCCCCCCYAITCTRQKFHARWINVWRICITWCLRWHHENRTSHFRLAPLPSIVPRVARARAREASPRNCSLALIHWSECERNWSNLSGFAAHFSSSKPSCTPSNSTAGWYPSQLRTRIWCSPYLWNGKQMHVFRYLSAFLR